MSIKDSLLQLARDIEDVITEIEDSDEITNSDVRAELFDALDDAQGFVADAILAL